MSRPAAALGTRPSLVRGQFPGELAVATGQAHRPRCVGEKGRLGRGSLLPLSPPACALITSPPLLQAARTQGVLDR